ncbi:YfbM family protein [Nocardia thailandica]
MGVTMSFARIALDDLRRMLDDAAWGEEFLARFTPPEGDPDGDLDKAWGGLDFLLTAAEAGVDLCHAGIPLESGGGRYTAWRPKLVAATAERLGGLAFDELAGHYDPPAMEAAEVYPPIWARDGDDALPYLRAGYRDLVAIFAHAARSGYPLLQRCG